MRKWTPYVGATFGLSFALGFGSIHLLPEEMKEWGLFLMGVVPAAVAILMIRRQGGGMRDLGFTSPRWRALGGSALIPMAYLSVILAVLVMNGAHSYPAGPPTGLVGLALATGVILVGPILGEEVGWRGFLEARLVERFGLDAGIVALGLIWGLWHLPVALNSHSLVDTPVYEALVHYPVFCVFLSYILAYTRQMSGSIWGPAVAHAFNNGIAGTFILSATRARPLTESAVTLGVLGVFAGLLRRRLKMT